MESRRKTAGTEIATAREVRFSSQSAFAESLGISDSSVANAERGAETVGVKVYRAIARGLGWPANCIWDYINSGDEKAFARARGEKVPEDDAVVAAPTRDPDEALAARLMDIGHHYRYDVFLNAAVAVADLKRAGKSSAEIIQMLDGVAAREPAVDLVAPTSQAD